MATEVGKTLGILLPPGTEQSWAYKTYMEACEHMAREMTPQERAAAFVQAWMKQSTYTTESFINDVLEHDKQTRRAALLEAAELAQHMIDANWEDGDITPPHEIVKALTRLAQEG